MLMMPICQSKLLNRTESFSKWPETGWCPPHLQKDPLNKENYKPLSLLSLVSKVFERLLYKQIVTNYQPSYLAFVKTINTVSFMIYARKMEKCTRQR